MLIEQIIEFQLRRPGPSGRTRSPLTDSLHDKKNSPRKIFERIIIYC